MIWFLIAVFIQGAVAEGSTEPCTGGYHVGSDTDGWSCTSCPGGKFYVGHWSYRSDACKSCPNGYFSEAGTVASNVCTSCPTSCTECPFGRYINKIGAAECEKCDAGKETLTTGSIGGESMCTNCSPGFYNDESGSRCEACSKGYYQSEVGQGHCKKCEAGSSSPGGSIWDTTCFKCDPGEYELYGICTNCTTGKYSPEGGQATCTDCIVGKYSDTGSTACTDCTKGKYNDQVGQGACTDCAAGKFSNAFGSSDVSVCAGCTKGKYSSAGSSSCNDCAAGRYTDTDVSGSCKSCLAGFYAGSSGLSSCTECGAGKYEDRNGSYSCKSCSPGKMSYARGTIESDCANCTIGRYSDVTECSLCSEGKTSSEGSSSVSDCVACGIGTHGNDGRTCTACSEGKFQNEEGSVTCKNCHVGRYSNKIGEDRCKHCEHGSYQDEHGKNACKLCGEGKYQNLIGKPECKDCGTGRYSKEEGAVISSVCIPYVENNILDNMDETCSLRVGTPGHGGLTKCPLFKKVTRSVVGELHETAVYTPMTLDGGSCSSEDTVISCFSPVVIQCSGNTVLHDGNCVDVLEGPDAALLISTFNGISNGVSQED